MRRRALLALAVLAPGTGLAQSVLLVRVGVDYDRNGRRPLFRIRSGLPDGVPLLATVTGPGYMAQARANTEAGAAMFGPFSYRGGQLEPGRYVLAISSPGVELWPPAAAALAGDGGSRLSGDVEPSPLGRVVAYRTTFTILAYNRNVRAEPAAR